MLSPRVRDSWVLDLFAGSGSLGLEALSRGAEKVIFVDKAPDPIRVIKENLDTLGMSANAVVIRAEVLDYLRKPRFPERPFDLIFIDPPYRIGFEYRREILRIMDEGGFLAPSAVIIIEAPLRSEPPPAPAGISFEERRKYGETAVDVYVKRE